MEYNNSSAMLAVV